MLARGTGPHLDGGSSEMDARRRLFLRAALAALGAMAVIPGVALATPANQRPPQVVNGSGDPVSTASVGQTLTCSDGTWNSADSFEYRFARDGTPFTAFGGTNTYQAAPADIGHAISCVVRATDVNDNNTAEQGSSNSTNVVPVGTVKLVRFSNQLSGNIGQNVQGVSVTVHLQRANAVLSPYDVATATGTTNSAGVWTGSLANANPPGGPTRAPFTDADLIVVHYAQGTAPGATVLPPDEAFSPFFNSLDAAQIAPNGGS